jgi:hypothetical protein
VSLDVVGGLPHGFLNFSQVGWYRIYLVKNYPKILRWNGAGICFIPYTRCRLFRMTLFMFIWSIIITSLYLHSLVYILIFTVFTSFSSKYMTELKL